MKDELIGLRVYLKEQGLKSSTIDQHINNANRYLDWLRKEDKKEEEIIYQEIILFIEYLKGEDYSIRLINRILLSVRYYYDYLNPILGMDRNPISGIYLRGQKQHVPNTIVDYNKLQQVYDLYQGLDNRTKRNKVMLGLMIYQGVTTSEIHRLEPHHIKLKDGKVYVPGSHQSNARMLDLQVVQLLELQNYINEVRPQMLSCLSEELWPVVAHYLFFSERGSLNLKPSLHHLFRAIKKLNPLIKSTQAIRMSVIVEWLRHDGIRQVQYKAGHRCVSSTERYRAYHLEELSEAVDKYHPLR